MLSRKHIHTPPRTPTAPPDYSQRSDTGWWVTLVVLLALATVVTAMFGA